MRSPHHSVFFATALLGLVLVQAHAQTPILHYRFDEAAGTRVINYAAGSGVAPAVGTLVTGNLQPRAPGRFGAGALAGSEGGAAYNYVDTGWDGAFTGSFTVAWFMKERTPLPNTLAYYLFGGGPSFRSFTAGAAGMGVRVAGWGGTPANLDTVADVRTPAATRWVHLALVVDATAGTATWYVDGQTEPSIPITGAANVLAGTSFFVGHHTRLTTTTFWDYDEFRFLNRAAVFPEILAWSQSAPAAEAPFGRGCGHTLAGTGGLPQPGNTAYALDLSGNPGAGLLAIGLHVHRLGALPLPLDLGPVIPSLVGCALEVSLELGLAGNVGPNPFPIPSDPVLLGATIYSQAVLFSMGQWTTSNALAISVGN